jgi:predicted nuclease of predicted toxin-antitoxin system
MRLIADESCDFRLVRSLRSAGHDVIAVAETQAGIDDDDVIHRARSERRLLLTEDKDFGHSCFPPPKKTQVSCLFDILHSRARVWLTRSYRS